MGQKAITQRQRPRVSEPEYRSVLLDSSAVDMGADDGEIRFSGHAAVFNQETLIGSERFGFYERIAPAAFSKTLQEADVRFLINHDPNLVLARSTNGSLQLGTDAVGLSTQATLAPTSYGKDLALLLERGIVNQMSFAFRPIVQETVDQRDGLPVVEVREVELFDVSAVTYPAYTGTDAGLRMVDGLTRSPMLRRKVFDVFGTQDQELDIEQIASLLGSDQMRQFFNLPSPSDTGDVEVIDEPVPETTHVGRARRERELELIKFLSS